MSAAVAAAAAASCCYSNSNNSNSRSNPSRIQNNYYNYFHQYSLLNTTPPPPPLSQPPVLLGSYESQKRRDWNTFLQYLSQQRPRLSVSRCSGSQVLEFMKYLDQFGKTKVHTQNCPFFGEPNSLVSCPCPLRQLWGSLDAMIGRLRAAFEENRGQSETNPFVARAVRLYLREVRDEQAKARGFG